jgi:PIN domain nuclease of toxin-antitoxin system
MNSYVVDTHALFWYMMDDARKLSRRASAAFDEADRGDALIYVPAIVLAELYYANRKEGSPLDFGHQYRQLRSTAQFVLLPFEPDDVLDFDETVTVPEMHDRIVVGVARRLDAPCITIDPSIVDSGLARVIW